MKTDKGVIDCIGTSAWGEKLMSLPRFYVIIYFNPLENVSYQRKQPTV